MTQCLRGQGRLLAIALLALLPAGAAAAQDRDRLNEVDPQAGFSSVSRAYQSMNARYARNGAKHAIAQVRGIAVGQPRERVQAALGRPAIRNGDGSYEFHLSLPLTRRDRLICQYRVFFDGAGHVERTVWRRPQCAELVLGTPK